MYHPSPKVMRKHTLITIDRSTSYESRYMEKNVSASVVGFELAWRPRPIPHAKWWLSGKGLVSVGKGHVLVPWHDFMVNE